MDKKDLARVLQEIGTALELTDDNAFKSRAYLNIAREIDHSPFTLEQLVLESRALEIKGLGQGLMERLQEFWQTGAIGLHTELLARVPVGLWDVLRIPGLGSKRVRTLNETLGVGSLSELEYACNENRLLGLKGFGPKMQENVLLGIKQVQARRGLLLLPEAQALAAPLLEALRSQSLIMRAELAGELRRSCPVVSRLELVAATEQPAQLLASLPNILPGAITWEIADSDRAVGLTPNGVSVGVTVCLPRHFAWTWWQLTGSESHLQLVAERLAAAPELRTAPDEVSIYSTIGLAWIPPVLREGLDEVTWTISGRLPRQLSAADLAGALHNHTTWSDGAATLAEMARAAEQIGWRYLGIADHSQTAVYAGGLSAERVRQQWQEIDQLRSQTTVRLLKGIESDILPDGRLDYEDELLTGFDYVVASVHSQLRQPAEQMQQRLLRALNHPATTILGHPTNRLLLGREESAIDMEALIAEAARLGKALELNSNPHRLDLDWRWCRAAKQAGVKVAINPDAHRSSGLQDVQYGVLVAQKAGLTPADLLHY